MGYTSITAILNLLNDALAEWAEDNPDAYKAVRDCPVLKVIDDQLEHLTNVKTGKLWLT
ncbi:gp007 [Erwinia phage vB_EamP-S6]|uniref:Gp007 n=1 Tax=Erwinia phage vB_EamP-S6 TaxID=1051675 RepID=G0YQ99_9CAUD|nr:gp007 [Erwinia phage vB_EamP-S6]AEJ81526.1 gp007 [Erwinia phage vB_EamP-S6]